MALVSSVEPYFRPRGECVVAAASVVEQDRGMLKRAKPRMVAIAAPYRLGAEGSGDAASRADLRHASIYVLATAGGKGGELRARYEVPVANLSGDGLTHVGGLEASFNATEEGDSVTVRLSFESSVQRETFTAAVRKAQRACQAGYIADDLQQTAAARAGGAGGAGGGAGGRGGYRGPQGPRGRGGAHVASHGIVSVEEEALLAKEARLLGMSLADAPAFDALLAGKIASREAASVREAIESAGEWDEASAAVDSMRGVVSGLEARVRKYSEELLSRRDVIQDIELESTYRHRKKRNLEAAIDELDATMAHLRLPKEDEDTIYRLVELEEDSDELQEYFRTERNVRALVRCIAHIERLIRQPAPEIRRYVGIEAVQERALVFDDLRADVATKAAVCIDVVAERAARHLVMSAESRERKTTRGRLVLLPPVEVFNILQPLAPLFPILRTTNYRRHCQAVRRFAGHMRTVYAFEVRRFFSELRRVVRRVGWRGSALLGDDETLSSADRVRRMAAQGELTPSPMLTPLRGSTPHASPGGSTNGDRKDPNAPPEVVLFGDDAAGFRLLRRGQRLMPPTTEVAKRDIVAGHVAPSGGFMRPDLAFAAALKATSDLVLVQRDFYTEALGLRSLPRRWMTALRRARDGEEATGAEAASSPTTVRHTTGLSDERALAALAELPPEERDLIDVDDVPPSLQEVTVADEVNTALWETFAAPNDTNPKSPSLIHQELLHTATVLAKKCDGLHLLAALSLLDRFLCTVEDGDSESSAPLDAMRRIKARQSSSASSAGNMSMTGTMMSSSSAASANATALDNEAMRAFAETRTGFFTKCLAECRSIMAHALHVYSAEQAQSINESARANQGSPTVMKAFSALPILIGRVDAMLTSYSDELPLARFETFLRDLVHHLFDMLDEVTTRAPATDEAARRYAVFKQYLHHAFFCVVVETASSSQLRAILNDFLAVSRSRRDHYESLYVSADIFPRAFPQFSSFMAVVDEARRMFNTAEDLRCHGALKPDKVQKACRAIHKEFPAGVDATASRLKKHFARAVPAADPAEDAFFRAALPVTFRHVHRFTVAKLEALDTLIIDLELDVDLPTPSDADQLFDMAGR